MDDSMNGRRRFLTGAAAAVLAGSLPSRLAAALPPAKAAAYKYPNPGRIVTVTHAGAVQGYNKVSEPIVQSMFDEGIQRFTGITSSPADALASLFPGLTTAKKIAIKPNLINSSVPTRKELVKALLTRLVQMLGGFPAANITLYERHAARDGGYSTSYFGVNAGYVQDASFPNLGYTIMCDGKARPYSKTLHDADYLINMPVLKDHYCGIDFTLAFKNHMGTVNPGGSLGICSNKKAVLDIMADPVMVQKQVLVVMDCLFGVINGGPGGSPQISPNTITISQDPVTSDYYGRSLINDGRKKAGYSTKAGGYIEEAAAAPYSIGVANPAEMTVIPISMTTGIHESQPDLDWTLSDCYPQPVSTRAEFVLDLPASSTVHAGVYDTRGRLLATIADGSLAPGSHILHWSPISQPHGMYILRVDIGGNTVTRSFLHAL